jgi:hypothetical protein
MVLAFLLYDAVFAALCYYIASARGLGPRPDRWALWGFLFGIFALIAVCATPARNQNRER